MIENKFSGDYIAQKKTLRNLTISNWEKINKRICFTINFYFLKKKIKEKKI